VLLNQVKMQVPSPRRRRSSHAGVDLYPLGILKTRKRVDGAVCMVVDDGQPEEEGGASGVFIYMYIL
jgi:hypothetical protein